MSETVRPRVTAGDCVIEILPDDREGITSADIHDLESYDFHGIEPMRVATCAVIPLDGRHVSTQNVCDAVASAKGNVRFSCGRKELVESPDLLTVYIKKPVHIGNSCSDELTVVSCLTIVSSCTPDSEPVPVSSSSEPEVTGTCDNNLLVVTGSDGESVAVNTSCVKRDSDEKSLVSSSAPVRELVGYDSPRIEHVDISALDEQCVVGGKDRKLVSLAEEGSSGEMAVCLSTDTVNLNEESTSQNTQNHSGTSGSRDEDQYTSTSARDGKVTSDQVIASYQVVMYNHHDRAATRLELRWAPFCCQNPFSCTQHHKSSLRKPSEVCDARSQMIEALMDARQWSYAFKFCCSFTCESSFPSASTALRILHFILNTHKIDLIGSAMSTFKKIVELHPPCAPNMLQYYTSVLTGAHREDTPHLSANGIVDDVMSKLNDMMLLNDLQTEDLSYRSEAALVTVNGTTGELDICADELAEVNKNYSTLSCDEKLNRLFMVLEIIVELLEIDLCVFLVKHSLQLRKALIHRSYRPLVASVLWGTSMVKGIGHLNGICRCIIALYAKCFVHNMNFNKWNAIARLVTLVAETVRASECNDELLFPYFGEQCQTLAREVSQCLSGMNPEVLVQVLSEMRPSFLSLYVTNFLLSNAVGYETSPSLDTAVELISSCFLLQDEEAQKLNHEIHTTSASEATETMRNINKRDQKGETILHRVCRKNRVNDLKELLKDPNIDVNVADNFGWTALHEAVRHGAVDCVFELLQYRPPPGRCRTDIHIHSCDGTTPLIDAAQSSQLESCELLLEYGGSSLLRAKNQDGRSALDVATSPEIRRLLESFRSKQARWQHCSLVSKLLPVMVHSYIDTYLTLHIENELKSRMYHSDINTVRVERRGRPKLKFDYSRFLRDYKSLRKLKAIVRNESKKVPASEVTGKFLFLFQ